MSRLKDTVAMEMKEWEDHWWGCLAPLSQAPQIFVTGTILVSQTVLNLSRKLVV